MSLCNFFNFLNYFLLLNEQNNQNKHSFVSIIEPSNVENIHSSQHYYELNQQLSCGWCLLYLDYGEYFVRDVCVCPSPFPEAINNHSCELKLYK